LLVEGSADLTALRARVEGQHQAVLDSLEAGSLELHDIVPPHAAADSGALEVKLRNVQWLGAGRASLEIEVSQRSDGQQIDGAELAVLVEGLGDEPRKIPARTDAKGYAKVEFALPVQPDSGPLTLLIEARAPQGQSHLRYRLKPKPAAAAPPKS